MNLLIVDDEYYSADGIARKILNASLGISNLFQAYSLSQAQKRFATDRIDILITDIEMPKGSGLELAAWVREQKYSTVCIFLTSFAKFDYASAAIQLQGFDYLLKPVEEEQLLGCVRKALGRADQIAGEAERTMEASKWRSARSQLMDQFWLELMEGLLLPDKEFLSAELSRRNLPADCIHSLYFPLLVRYQQTIEGDSWERSLFEFAAKNILTEILYTINEWPAIVRLSDSYYLLPLYAAISREENIQKCQQAADACNRHLPGRFCFFFHSYCGIEGIPGQTRLLLSVARTQLDTKGGVRDLLAPQPQKAELTPIPTAFWAELLTTHKTDQLLREARTHLLSLSQHDTAQRNDLIRFYHDFLQIAYTALDKKSVSAHQLFDTRMPQIPVENACDSIEHMIGWVEQMLDNYLACIEPTRQPTRVVQEVCRYILEHLADDLSRDDLAGIVFISPDYLSHVFREQTGQSLTYYIIEQRVRRAKELLLSSEHTIRDIAIMSGFQNISYFAKQFKRSTGKTPQSYRKAP